MIGRRTPINFIVSLCIAVACCSLSTDIIAARTLGWHITRRIPYAILHNKSGMLELSDNLKSANELNLSFVARTCRGGATVDEEEDEEEKDEYDEYDSDDEEDDIDVQSSSSPTAISSLKSALSSLSKAIMRALSAATRGAEPDDDEKEASLVSKVFQTVKNMISAALNPEYDINTRYDNEEEDVKATEKSQVEPTSASDFGSYLSQAYGVVDGREDAEKSPILGGSLNDALKIARSSAKLLVVLIPSVAPNKSKQKTDGKAITSFLSAEVAKVANKKARKKGETASFVLWSAKAGSSEATQAMKRLKAKPTSSKGEKRPILSVVYPAQVSADSDTIMWHPC